jgi:hypothetical protein
MEEEMEQKFIPSDFGLIPVGDVPDEYTSRLRTDEAFIKLCEQVYCIGGQIGTSPARLVRQPDHGDGGARIGWRIYVVVPFTGEFMYEVSREEFTK